MIQSDKSSICLERIPSNSDSALIAKLHSGKIHEAGKFHYHPEIEFTLILSGRGRALLNSQWHTFVAGDCFMISPDLPHLFIPPPNSPEECRTIVLQLKPGFPNSPLLSLVDFLPLAKLVANCSSSLLFKDDGSLQEKLTKLLDSSGTQRLLTLLSILFQLAALPSVSLGSSNKTDFMRRQCNREEIEHAVSYISEHFQEKLTLAQVASVVHMDLGSFRRFFRQSLLIGFSDYLLNLRMTYAENQLLYTRKSISEIAFESGFNNLSNFNRLFLKYHKMPPRQYRIASPLRAEE
jgi:AraC-like DNA-binding protein/quercetin dioxygenase-like cupin family protein